jgi:hypothetical protein
MPQAGWDQLLVKPKHAQRGAYPSLTKLASVRVIKRLHDD